MRVVAIVPSAGYGKRLGAKAKKPFVMLGSRPLVSYALKALEGSPAIDGIIVAAEKDCVRRIRDIAKRFKIRKLIGVVAGGKTRFDSVRNCVKAIGQAFDVVLIHDAARPFIDKLTIKRSIAAAVKFGACIVAVPESDTVKLTGADLFIRRTLDRNRIFRAQTPQVFKYEIIKKAYSVSRRHGITDDAGLAERLGYRVKILKGSCKNIKITTPEDLKIAEALL